MECLSPEQMVLYVRGGGADPRGVEAHVRDCPACAMDLLLVRETLGEARAKASRPATDRFRMVAPRAPSQTWIPWVAAAAVLFGAVVFAVLSQKPSTVPNVAKQPEPKKPAPVLPEPKPQPEPRPLPPPPEPPTPRPEPKPEPRPEPKPEPRPEPPVKPPEPKPEPKPPAPEPKPEPKKPAPTLVEKAVVAKVLHSVGGAASSVGRAVRAGETLATARQEFLHVALEGYGNLYLRENTQAEIGERGEISLHEGEMLARLDPGKRLGALKTAIAPVETQAPVFNVLATKTTTEVSILSGRVMVASATASGPATILLKGGKAEVKPLESGFASWVPDKLAAKKFTGWYEAEEFSGLQGFKAMRLEQASGGHAAVQVADAGVAVHKGGLPFKGRHVVWVRVRQYEAKATMIGLHVNGQSAGEVKLEGAEGKPWRWVGPLAVTSDRLDLAVTALSRWPFREGEGAARSFPVAVDVVAVSSDLKFVPPERVGDEPRGVEFSLDDPQK
jgi:hypothetical protein